MIKIRFMLSCSLLLGLLACAPTNSPLPPGNSQQQLLTDAEIQSQVQSFSLNIFSENAAGVRNPLSPDALEYIQLSPSHRISAQQLVLPGTEQTASLNNRTQQRELLGQVAKGEAKVFFSGAGQYSVFMPHSERPGVLSLKLKDHSQTYPFLRATELQHARLILKANGTLQAEMDAGSQFRLMHDQTFTPQDWLAQLLESKTPAERLQLFQLAQPYLLYVQNNQALLRSPDLSIESLQISENGSPQPGNQNVDSTLLEEVANEFGLLSEQLADRNHQILLNFAGRWEPESAFLKALIPGNQLIVGLSFSGDNSFQASAELAERSFSTQGTLPDLSGQSADSLSLTVSHANQRVQVELKALNENRLSLTLVGVEGATELTPLLNNPVYLNRIL